MDEMKVARPPVKGKVARPAHHSTLRTHPRRLTVVVHGPRPHPSFWLGYYRYGTAHD
eukprot:COSAG06_NODE_22900_length_709_cov_1.339344_1_plen_56_part_01